MQEVFGGSSSQSSQQSQSSSNPVDMTPSAFAGLQSPLANAMLNLFSGGPVYNGITSAFTPTNSTTTLGGGATSMLANPAQGVNAFSAPLSANENTLLGLIQGNATNPNPAMTGATNYISSVLNPNFLDPNSNPFLQKAISSATAPILSAFQNTTLPNLIGQFVANGHVLNGPAQVGPGAAASGAGSSAFDKAAAIAGQGLDQAIGSATSNIENNAMNLQNAASAQVPALTTAQVNSLVTSLQAEALPRLIQQYGLDQGLQEFNNRVNVMLQAMGLGASKAGPDLAQTSQSTSSGGSNYSSSKGIVPDLVGAGGI